MSPRPFWSGSVSFGLVNVPVSLVPATLPQRAAFHMLHARDGARLERRMYCPAENVFVEPEHTIRGYEVEEGQYVIVEDEEIEAIAPQRSTTIEIESFVDRAAIGPAYYDRPYYLSPTGAVKPYALLVDVLEATAKAGIARFVMHQRENLAALMSIGGALCLMILRFPEELRSADDIATDTSPKKADVAAMKKAIRAAAGAFAPGALKDEYQERIARLVQEKMEHGETIREGKASKKKIAKQAKAADPDILAALEHSLEAEKKRSKAKA